jgi:ribonuclease G
MRMMTDSNWAFVHEILLNVESKEIRYASLHNGRLHDLLIERRRTRQLTGNVYRGRVTNILKNIQSAFIDIDEGENGFVHISDIVENIKKFEQMFDMDFKLPAGKEKKSENADISQFMKADQPVLVQVVKEPIGNKGARLTSNISLAGRYLVLLPNSPHRGVSRRIEDAQDRERIKRMVRSLQIPPEMGIICRTASQHASLDMLIDEAQELVTTWKQIMDKFNAANGPCCLYQESDIVKKALLTALDQKVGRLLIDDYATYQSAKKLYTRYAVEHPLRIEYYRDKMPMFERFHVEREIERTLQRRIWLSSGGYLYFDQTEAMVTIDVNSGRASTSGGDVEEALVQINMEAAEEIARQLRLRNIGGLIVCDFIDMRLRKNQKRVLEKLRDAMKDDVARTTILNISEFGLVEMTRQRSRESLSQMVMCECPYCQGKGQIKNNETVAIEIERALKKVIDNQQQFALKLVTHPQMDQYLDGEEREWLRQLADKLNAHLEFGTRDTLHLNEFEFYSTLNGKRIDA